MNKFSYFESTYKFRDRAIIESIQKDDRGYFLVLDHTIFYPQGGGQPSDQGQVKWQDISIPILFVKVVNNEIRHYTDRNYSQIIGQKADCFINQERRLLHAKLHTAGHLISYLMESLYPNCKAIKGHHFPNECYIEFTIKNGSIEVVDLNLLNKNIVTAINESYLIEAMFIEKDRFSEVCPDLPHNIHMDERVRIVRIGNFPYQPCGGTHVHTTLELHGLEATKFKINKDTIKISYLIKV